MYDGPPRPSVPKSWSTRRPRRAIVRVLSHNICRRDARTTTFAGGWVAGVERSEPPVVSAGLLLLVAGLLLLVATLRGLLGRPSVSRAGPLEQALLLLGLLGFAAQGMDFDQPLAYLRK